MPSSRERGNRGLLKDPSRLVLQSSMRFAIDLLTSGALIVSLDLWSKRIVEARDSVCRPSNRRWPQIRLVTNRRPIYGRRGARIGLVLTWWAALVSAAVLYGSGRAFQSDGALLALGAAFGGAAGNLVGILRHAAIVDFIDLGWWPVFNLADIAITGGLAATFWLRS
jgi:signal peptidase II